jgi:hypothetical protein
MMKTRDIGRFLSRGRAHLHARPSNLVVSWRGFCGQKIGRRVAVKEVDNATHWHQQ